MDAASRMIQDGGSARVADVAEIEHDLLGRLVVAGGVMENLVSADDINRSFYAQRSYRFTIQRCELWVSG